MMYNFTKERKGNLLARLLLFVFAMLGVNAGVQAQAPEVTRIFTGVNGTSTSQPIVNVLGEGKTLFWTGTDNLKVEYSAPVEATAWKLIQGGNVVAEGTDDASGMNATTHVINCKAKLLTLLQEETLALGDVTLQLDATVGGTTYESVSSFTCNLTDAPHLGIFRYYNSETTPIKGNSSTYVYFATGAKVTKAVCEVYQNDEKKGELEYTSATGGNSVTCKKDVLGPFLETVEAGLLIFKVKEIEYKSPIDGTTVKTFIPNEGDYEDGRIAYTGAYGTVKSESHLLVDANTIQSWYPADGEKGILKFTFSEAAKTEGINAYLEYGAGDIIPQTPVEVSFENSNKTLVVDLRGLPLNPTALAQGQTFADEQGNPITPKTINLQVKNLKTAKGAEIGMNVTYVASYDENGNPTGGTKTYFVKGIFREFNYKDITFDTPVLAQAEFYAAADPDTKTEGITDASDKMDLTIENADVIASADMTFIVEGATIATVADADITKSGSVWTVELPAEVKAAGSSKLSIALDNVTYKAEDGAEHNIQPLSLAGIASTVSVSSIAELKELPNGAQVIMNKNADVAYVTMAKNGYVFIEDESGAIQVSDENGTLAEGKMLSGTINGTYANGIFTLTGGVIMSEGTLEPAVMTVEDAKKAENLNRLVKFTAENSTIAYLGGEEEDEDYYIIGSEIPTINDFLAADYERPENVESIAGILYNPGQSLMLLVRSEADIVAVEETIEVNSIAELKALGVEDLTTVIVNVENAKVTYANEESAVAYLEDATGAIEMYCEDVIPVQGTALTGKLTVQVAETGMVTLVSMDCTAEEASVAEGTEVTDLAQLPSLVNRLVTINSTDENPIEKDEDNFGAIVGSTPIVDWFGVLADDYEFPAKIKSVTGIVMEMPGVGFAEGDEDDEDEMRGGHSSQIVIAPRSADDIVGEPKPEDIVLNLVTGDIAAALAAEKAKVELVGDITINLAEGYEYTVSATLEAPNSITINGNGAFIDASALTAPFITLNGTTKAATQIDAVAEDETLTTSESTSFKYIENVKIDGVTITGLKKALVRDEQKTYVENVLVNNSNIEVVGSASIIDFASKGYPSVIKVSNSTLWSKEGHTGFFAQLQNRLGDIDKTKGKVYSETIAVENSTFYNIAVSKKMNNLNQKGQTWLTFTLKNSIFYNVSTGDPLNGWNGGQDSTSPTMNYENNTYWSADGEVAVWTDDTKNTSDKTGTAIQEDPKFKDAANGDFTLYAGSGQAKFQTGDPRWLVEYDETLGINGINAENAALNGSIFNLAGQKVDANYKGIVIKNGKKMLNK